MKIIVTGLLVGLTLIGCSNKKEREIALKQLDNSNQRLIDFKNELEGTETRLTTLKAKLEVSLDRLQRTKGFQLLRSPEEREQQIKNASIEVLAIENNIKATESRLLGIQDSIRFTETKIINFREQLKN